MNTGTLRKLVAILHADIAGYSRLMGADEEATIDRLTDYRAMVTAATDQHGGRVVDTAGDSILAEFSSAVAVAKCALELQQQLKIRNEELPPERRLEFRMGIEIADVITRDDAVFGDGVNVAARIQALAGPGEVYVSDAVRRAVSNRLPVAFEAKGEHAVKNIAEPVKVYRLVPQGETNLSSQPERVSEDARQGQVSEMDKPAIAVLPFKNMSGEPDQEYFADGISEDIITGLSKFHWFYVIARNSSFTYKGTAIDIKKIGQELGVAYVVEGSVRRSGEHVRINAQLIDARSGMHIWAERYDRAVGDIFSVQDQISEAVVTAVAPAFVSAEARRAGRKTPENFSAWDYTARGNWHLWHRGRDEIAEARRLFTKALEIDPTTTTAMSGLAFALCWTYIFGWDEQSDTDKTRESALTIARRAVDLDDTDAWGHAILGWALFSSRQVDAAVVECERALELNPSLALAESVLSIASSWLGDNDGALRHADLARRLSPRDPGQSMWSFALACAEFGAENYTESVKWAKLATSAMREFPGAWRYLAASLGHLDRLEEARAAVAQLLRVMPHDNLQAVHARLPAVHPARMEQFVDGLRKAGLPE